MLIEANVLPLSQTANQFVCYLQAAMTIKTTPITSHTRISDNIVEHHETFKLQLQLLLCRYWQQFGLKFTQPEVSIFVSINKELE